MTEILKSYIPRSPGAYMHLLPANVARDEVTIHQAAVRTSIQRQPGKCRLHAGKSMELQQE